MKIISLNNEIEKILLDAGALRVGFVNKESMKGGPPSSDLDYTLPEAQSAISFALPLDKEKIRAFLRKDIPNGRRDHEIDNIETYLRSYKIGNPVIKLLKDRGYKAWQLFPNFKYREDVPHWQVMSYPPLSLRYLAVRSGVGTYGWSGNVGIKGIGAPIILAGIVTSAALEPTEPIPPEETFCNECKLCVKVCPLRMFDDKEKETVTLGDYTFDFSRRNHLMRCFISCGGFSGLDKTGKWSTWSPGRFPYPETRKDIVNTLAKSFTFKHKWYIEGEREKYQVSKLQEDSGLDDLEFNTLLKSNKYALKMLKNTTLTCGNCQLVCWGDSKQTNENYKMLINSGCVIIKPNKEIKVLPSKDAQKTYDEMGGYKRGIGKRALAWVAKRYLNYVEKDFKRD